MLTPPLRYYFYNKDEIQSMPKRRQHSPATILWFCNSADKPVSCASCDARLVTLSARSSRSRCGAPLRTLFDRKKKRDNPWHKRADGACWPKKPQTRKPGEVDRDRWPLIRAIDEQEMHLTTHTTRPASSRCKLSMPRDPRAEVLVNTN